MENIEMLRVAKAMDEQARAEGNPPPISDEEWILFRAILYRHGVSSTHYNLVSLFIKALNMYAGGNDGVRAEIEILHGQEEDISLAVFNRIHIGKKKEVIDDLGDIRWQEEQAEDEREAARHDQDTGDALPRHRGPRHHG
jgi:hypothetical protein